MLSSPLGAAIKGRLTWVILFLLAGLAVASAAFAPVTLPNGHGQTGIAHAYADGDCPYGPAPKPDPNTPCYTPTPTPIGH